MILYNHNKGNGEIHSHSEMKGENIMRENMKWTKSEKNLFREVSLLEENIHDIVDGWFGSQPSFEEDMIVNEMIEEANNLKKRLKSLMGTTRYELLMNESGYGWKTFRFWFKEIVEKEREESYDYDR